MWALVPFMQGRSRSFSPYQIVKRSLRTISSKHTSLMCVCVCIQPSQKHSKTVKNLWLVLQKGRWNHGPIYTSSCINKISVGIINNQFHLAVHHDFRDFKQALSTTVGLQCEGPWQPFQGKIRDKTQGASMARLKWLVYRTSSQRVPWSSM